MNVNPHADDAVLQVDADPTSEDAAFVQEIREYEETRGPGDTLSDAADEISEAWRRMRGIIGPF